jgi:glyoxylase-like metal-dependent hydrolase (beta-lactamase superfamily II)
MGTALFDAEAEKRGFPRPVVIAHANLPARFDRYVLTKGYNEVINERQFRVPVKWPTKYRHPDVTYDVLRELVFGEGEEKLVIQLFHGKGETDDATYIWIDKYRLLLTGDMFCAFHDDVLSPTPSYFPFSES